MEKNLFLKRINKKINTVEDIIRPSIIINSPKSLLNRELSLNELLAFQNNKYINKNIYYKLPLQMNNSCFFEKIIKLSSNKKFDTKSIKNIIKTNNNNENLSKIYKKKIISFTFSKPKKSKSLSTLTNSNSTINTTINNNLYLINNNETPSEKNSKNKENIFKKECKNILKKNNNKIFLTEKKNDYEKINQISLTIKTNKTKLNKNKKYNLEFNYIRNKEKNKKIITQKENEKSNKQLKNENISNLICNLEEKFNNEYLNFLTPKNKRNNNLIETQKTLTNQSKKNNEKYKYDFSFNFFKRNIEK